MLDREKVLAVLKYRFPTASRDAVAAAANAIVGLEDEWEELRSEELPEPPRAIGEQDIRIYRRRG